MKDPTQSSAPDPTSEEIPGATEAAAIVADSLDGPRRSLPASEQSGANRRREARQEATGTVEFDVIDEIPGAFQGQLVEISTHGMRMLHNCPRLEGNMMIRFRHPYGSGIARVVWNRRTGTGVESGFEVQA